MKELIKRMIRILSEETERTNDDKIKYHAQKLIELSEEGGKNIDKTGVSTISIYWDFQSDKKRNIHINYNFTGTSNKDELVIATDQTNTIYNERQTTASL